MSSNITAKIEINPRKIVYFTGDDVQGTASIYLPQDTLFRHVVVICKGRSFVYWSESSGNSTTSYKDDREIFRKEHYVVGNQFGPREHEPTKEGTHEFPFIFRLPSCLPSSFESARGTIRYSVKIKAKINWRKTIESKVYFTVNHILNLRCEPIDLKRPVDVETSKTRYCCCFEIGSVDIVLKTNKLGYVPGEKILLSGYIINRGCVSVKSVVITIRQMRIYMTSRNSFTDDMIVQKVVRPGLKPKERSNWDNVAILVPALVATPLKHSTNIKVIYALSVKAVLPLKRSVKAVSEDLVIGSIPTSDAQDAVLCRAPAFKKETVEGADKPFLYPAVLHEERRMLTQEEWEEEGKVLRGEIAPEPTLEKFCERYFEDLEKRIANNQIGQNRITSFDFASSASGTNVNDITNESYVFDEN